MFGGAASKVKKPDILKTGARMMSDGVAAPYSFRVFVCYRTTRASVSNRREASQEWKFVCRKPTRIEEEEREEKAKGKNRNKKGSSTKREMEEEIGQVLRRR